MSSMGPVVGQVLGHYRILEEIGAGGMGVVYRAHDERLDRDVALKLLPLGALGDERARRRLREEAVALARLNYTNIATIHDFDSRGALDFLVMEHVVGVTLADKLAGRPLPESELLALAEQITKPLQEAHEHGVIHRDLKPGNIIVTVKGQLKLLDFGLAQLLAAGGSRPTETTASQHIVGTLPYMAPEQLSGQCDCRTDIYAVGAILYEMATGQRPFRQPCAGALASDIINTLPVPSGQVNPRVSRKLEDVILKCLEKDPDNRYQSAQEITVDLRRQQSATHSSATIGTVVDRRRRRRAALASALGVLAVLALLVGSRYWRDPTVVSPNRVRSLAVLPLDNLSGDPEQEYFTEGMTDEFHALLGYYGVVAPRDAFPKAKAAALNALALDETLSEAHATLALVADYYEWTGAGASVNWRERFNSTPARRWHTSGIPTISCGSAGPTKPPKKRNGPRRWIRSRSSPTRAWRTSCTT